jgi:hypothetical protein
MSNKKKKAKTSGIIGNIKKYAPKRGSRKKRRTKRRRKSLFKKKRRKKRTRTLLKRRKKRTRRTKRRRRQKGGGCQNPFVGKPASSLGNGNYNPSEPSSRLPYAKLTRQPQGGGGLWQDLGLTVPKEVYNDGLSYLKNIKNTWVGDNHISNSNVLKQPIANTKNPTMHPVNYFDEFKKADASIANELKFNEDVVNN